MSSRLCAETLRYTKPSCATPSARRFTPPSSRRRAASSRASSAPRASTPRRSPCCSTARWRASARSSAAQTSRIITTPASTSERDYGKVSYVDVARAIPGGICPVCGKPSLRISNGIEVGNIFQLGDKYTKSMNMQYLDENGALQYPIMGCYGIGVGRHGRERLRGEPR